MAQLRKHEESPKLLRRALLPLCILILGLALTVTAAIVGQNSSEREQELLFESSVAAEQQNFESQLNNVLDEFDDAVDFMAATFPTSPEIYQAFFEDLDAGRELNAQDPGVVLIEVVPADGVASLEARELTFGHDGFQVGTFNAGDDEHYVLTRSSRLSAGDLASPVGIDLRPFLTDEVIDELQVSEVLTLRLNDAPAVSDALNVDTNVGPQRLPPTVLTQRVSDRESGELIGWAGWSFNPRQVLLAAQEASEQSLNVSVQLLGQSVDLVDVDPDTDKSFSEARLSEQIPISLLSSEFTMSIWADDDFGVSTGLFAQSSIWSVGLATTFALFVISVLLAVNQHLTDRSSFELNHARTLASTDPLTGLLNRKGFIEMAETLDVTQGGTLFFIDLDGFKNVNDTLGHSEGDRVLRTVAQAIRTPFRNDDLVSRFGGDEFMIYTPGLFGPEMEAEAAGRIVSAIAAADLGVTCSIGAAQRIAGDDTPIETLTRKADRAMYRAKEAGGNGFRRARITS